SALLPVLLNGCHRINADSKGSEPPRDRVFYALGWCLREQRMSSGVCVERGIAGRAAEATAFSIILALGFSHFLNDMIQSLVPALYPMLKESYGLSFAQIGVITLTMQAVSSLLQPAVGLVSDRRPQPYSLAVGMGVTLIGLVLLAAADGYGPLL